MIKHRTALRGRLLTRLLHPQGMQSSSPRQYYMQGVRDTPTLARFMSRPASELPAMELVMKAAKMSPWGIFSPLGLSAGVHRNTKVYIDASNSDCMAPSSAMRWSAGTGVLGRVAAGSATGASCLLTTTRCYTGGTTMPGDLQYGTAASS